jgi:choline dehydrogenase-like flavoprotein
MSRASTTSMTPAAARSPGAGRYKGPSGADPHPSRSQKKIFPDRDPVSRAIARWGLGKSLAIGAAIHECGGARMGSDPARSVLNEYNQSWDVPNLFVTDGSCYVSTGAVGPTLTIMALTTRACEHIAAEHADGSLL